MKKQILQIGSLLMALTVLFVSIGWDVKYHYCTEDHHLASSFVDATDTLCHNTASNSTPNAVARTSKARFSLLTTTFFFLKNSLTSFSSLLSSSISTFKSCCRRHNRRGIISPHEKYPISFPQGIGWCIFQPCG